MKKILATVLFAFLATSFNVQAETKKVCVKDEKTKKETCKVMKVHEKLEGTKVPEKKK